VKDFRGYRPPLSTSPFESLVTSISAQQVNLAFAFATRSRLVSAFGPAVRTPDGDVFHAFPSPSDLAGARASRLRAMQFSGTRPGDLSGAGCGATAFSGARAGTAYPRNARRDARHRALDKTGSGARLRA
jgi:hypothetical protein